jgi:hypothetical protein
VSGLARFFEEEGLATVVISLVREHTERIKPPRALWVPFQLGRPLGAPDDPAFQTRVLRAALALFAAPAGPVIGDFDEDAPGVDPEDYSGWVCPVNLPAPPDSAVAPDSLLAQLRDEIDSLAPWYDLARERRGRTTVGVSGLAIVDAAALLTRFLDDPELESPDPALSAPHAAKFAADDLKAWYLDAATARPGAAGSTALNDWFWGETAAGRLLLRLSAVCRGIDAPVMQWLGHKALVPRTHEHLVP